MYFLLNIITVSFEVVELFVVAHVILSWIRVDRNNRIVQFIDKVVNPMLSLVRDKLPKTGMIDLSPLVLLIGLQVVRSIIISIFLSF